MTKDSALYDIMEITQKYHNEKMNGKDAPDESQTLLLRAIINLAFEALNNWDCESINQKMDKINDLICDLQDSNLSVEQYAITNKIDRIKDTITHAIGE